MSAFAPPYDPASINPEMSLQPTVPPKRKRGRPRKNEVQGFERLSKQRSVHINSGVTVSDNLAGQHVHGILDGVFSAGYLITVQVGRSGQIMKGLVFQPNLSVPVTAENDIAPHLPFFTRHEFPRPTQAPQNEPNHHSVSNGKAIEMVQMMGTPVVSNKTTVKDADSEDKSSKAPNMTTATTEMENAVPSNSNSFQKDAPVSQSEVLLQEFNSTFPDSAVEESILVETLQRGSKEVCADGTAPQGSEGPSCPSLEMLSRPEESLNNESASTKSPSTSLEAVDKGVRFNATASAAEFQVNFGEANKANPEAQSGDDSEAAAPSHTS